MHPYEHMVLPGLHAHDRTFEHAETGWGIGVKSRRYRHFYEHVFTGRYTFQGDENASGANVYSGTEFESGTTVLIGPVDENGKG